MLKKYIVELEAAERSQLQDIVKLKWTPIIGPPAGKS